MVRDSQSSVTLPLRVDRPQAVRILTALEMLEQRETHLDPALRFLRDVLRDALIGKSSGDVIGGTSTE